MKKLFAIILLSLLFSIPAITIRYKIPMGEYNLSGAYTYTQREVSSVEFIPKMQIFDFGISKYVSPITIHLEGRMYNTLENGWYSNNKYQPEIRLFVRVQ